MASDLKKWDVLRKPIRPVNANAISVPIGLNNTFGPRITIIDARELGYAQLILDGINDTRSGTFASGETVTVRHICVFDDGSESYVDRSYTTTGANTYSAAGLNAEFYPFRDNTRIPVAFVVQAKTNMASTSVTLVVYAMGWMW
jgi:hypothetical protein